MSSINRVLRNLAAQKEQQQHPNSSPGVTNSGGGSNNSIGSGGTTGVTGSVGIIAGGMVGDSVYDKLRLLNGHQTGPPSSCWPRAPAWYPSSINSTSPFPLQPLSPDGPCSILSDDIHSKKGKYAILLQIYLVSYFTTNNFI